MKIEVPLGLSPESYQYDLFNNGCPCPEFKRRNRFMLKQIGMSKFCENGDLIYGWHLSLYPQDT